METGTETATTVSAQASPELRRNSQTPSQSSSFLKRLSTGFSSPVKKERADANGTPIKSPSDSGSQAVAQAEMRQEIAALKRELDESLMNEKLANRKVGELEYELAQKDAALTGEAVAGIGSVSRWSKVYFAGAVISALFLVLLAGGSPMAAWLALTQDPAVGMEILVSRGSLAWRPAAFIGATLSAASLVCLAAVAGQAIRGLPKRAAFVALLAADAAFFLYLQGDVKEFLRTHAVQAGAKAGFKLVHETDVPMLLVALDALVLLAPGLLELAFLHARPGHLGGEITKAVQGHLGWLRSTLPLLRPILFRSAVLAAYTLSKHPNAAALRMCTSPGSCPASSKRMPLECAPPSASIYDWLSHSITGDSHSLQLDCHGSRPKVGQAEWLACRAFFAPK